MLKRIYATSETMTPLVIQPTNSKRRVAVLKQSDHKNVQFKDDMLYTLVRAISARVNQNFDGFPSTELKKAYKTFIGRPVFVNHANTDEKRTRGMIVDSQYKEAGTDKYIELLLEVDAKQYPKLAANIASGALDSVSMGTDVEFTKCSYCDNTAYEVEDFCDHIRTKKGRTLSKMGANGRREDVLVYEACYGLNFFEISYVFDPADETAINQRVYLPKHSSMNKSALGEVTSPADVDTLRGQESCPVCGDENFNGKDCSLCEYVAPPEEMQDPDTAKSRVMQMVRTDPAQQEMVRNAPPNESLISPTGKEGRRMGDNPTRLQAALARQRLAEAQRRLAEDESADMTTDEARESDSTDVQNIDQEFTSREEATEPDEKTDVTKLPDYKNASVIAQNRAKYLASKKAAFGQDDPDQQAGSNPVATPDPQAGAPSTSDGPNSGPPTDDSQGTSGVDSLPIDWKADESGQPYGTIQGTDLDIFVNEDMSWQVLPEGSNDPIAQGQGSSYEDCVQQAYQQGSSLGDQAQGDPSAPPADPSQAPPAGPPAADPSAPPADPNDPNNKQSRRRKRADGDGKIPEDADPDARVDVEKLPDYDTITTDRGQYETDEYNNNSFEDKTKPVDGSDKQNFAPGGKPFGENTKTTKKVTAAKALELVEAYVDAGIIPNTRVAKFQAVAQFENLSQLVVAERLNLLDLVEQAKGRTAAMTPRGTVPRQRSASNIPSMSRAAATTHHNPESSNGQDYLALL